MYGGKITDAFIIALNKRERLSAVSFDFTPCICFQDTCGCFQALTSLMGFELSIFGELHRHDFARRSSDAQNTAFRNWAGWEAHDDQSTTRVWPSARSR